jgi:hypothetical protein
MKNTPTLKYDFRRDTYWAKVDLKSPKDSDKKTSIYVCASYEYLWETLKTKELEGTKLKTWFEKIIDEWKEKGEVIFKKQEHFDIRSVTIDGYKNGLTFLKTEIS